MEKNKKIITVVVVIVIAGVSFFAGTKFGSGGKLASVGNFNGGQYSRGVGMGGGTVSNMMNGTRTGRLGNGMTSGQIISRDDKSITVKMRSGGSKIVFFTSNTPVVKSVNGVESDIKVGSEVSVSGTPNTDGSINAESIQIRNNISPTPVRQ
jgi:hypothetical protein